MCNPQVVPQSAEVAAKDTRSINSQWPPTLNTPSPKGKLEGLYPAHTAHPRTGKDTSQIRHWREYGNHRERTKEEAHYIVAQDGHDPGTK